MFTVTATVTQMSNNIQLSRHKTIFIESNEVRKYAAVRIVFVHISSSSTSKTYVCMYGCRYYTEYSYIGIPLRTVSYQIGG